MSKYLFALCLLCSTVGVFAQEESQSKAGSNVDIDILSVYEEVVAEGYASAQLYRTLANGRFLENNFIAAKKWYKLLLEIENEPEPKDLYQYSKTLEALNEDDQAKHYLERYNAIVKVDR